MQGEIADQIEAVAREAAQLAKDLDYYWDEEGVSQLGIFIDPDLYQYIERLYQQAREFALRCQQLAPLADQLRNS